ELRHGAKSPPLLIEPSPTLRETTPCHANSQQILRAMNSSHELRLLTRMLNRQQRIPAMRIRQRIHHRALIESQAIRAEISRPARGYRVRTLDEKRSLTPPRQAAPPAS